MIGKSSFVLFVLVMVTAYFVVTVRHENRLMFVGLQDLERTRQNLQYEWGRLMLERATWSTQHNLSEGAEKTLGMLPPMLDSIVVIERG